MTATEFTRENRILDCTLRDGGYYNKWDFNSDVVKNYLEAIAESGIDYVELGLRNFPRSGFLGPFAYTTESFLNNMELPVGPVYGVMVDAKTLLSSPLPIDEAIDTLFLPCNESKLGLVRVAAHFSEVDRCEPMLRNLKNKGYLVGLNMMQAGGKDSARITEFSGLVESWACVDVLYFADSLGNMDTLEVERIVTAIQAGWTGPTGIHTHNNMGQAVRNCQAASAAGVSWLDSTITGMGRGAGNAQTEYLLALFDGVVDKYRQDSVYKLVIRHFQEMKKQYGWGESLLYFLGAQNSVHPTYVQNLLSNSHYGTEEIVGAINYLSKLEESNSYDNMVLEGALSLSGLDKVVSGTAALKGRFIGREVLILGRGESVLRYQKDIERYISDRTPLVISVNISERVSIDLVDYFCVSHNSKFLSESQDYSSLNRPVILPEHRFTDDELILLEGVPEILAFGLGVEPGQMQLGEDHCILPHDLTLGYALCAALAGGAQKISLVGVDGYEHGDYRQLEMIELIECFKRLSELPVTALTPTTYPIDQGSIYAPLI